MSFYAYWIRVTEDNDGDAKIEWLSARDEGGVAATIIVPAQERQHVAEALLRGINLAEQV